MLISWGAEEHGLMGSNEWAEVRGNGVVPGGGEGEGGAGR